MGDDVVITTSIVRWFGRGLCRSLIVAVYLLLLAWFLAGVWFVVTVVVPVVIDSWVNG